MWWTLYYVTFQSTWFVSNFTAAGLSNIGCYNVDYWSSLLNSRDRNRNYCMDWLKYKTNTHKHTHKHTHNHIHTHTYIYIYIYMYFIHVCIYLLCVKKWNFFLIQASCWLGAIGHSNMQTLDYYSVILWSLLDIIIRHVMIIYATFQHYVLSKEVVSL